jgi:hypothetical protein
VVVGRQLTQACEGELAIEAEGSEEAVVVAVVVAAAVVVVVVMVIFAVVVVVVVVKSPAVDVMKHSFVVTDEEAK